MNTGRDKNHVPKEKCKTRSRENQKIVSRKKCPISWAIKEV
jgi:hypothetical protein